MTKTIQLSTGLTVNVKTENYTENGRPYETKYLFTVEEQSAKKSSSLEIVINDNEHVDFNSLNKVNEAARDSLTNFWKKYRELDEVEEIEEIDYLLPFVLFKLGIR